MLSASPAGRIRLVARLIGFTAVAYVLLWISGFPRQYDDDELPPSQRPKTAPNRVPHRVDADQLVVSVKTTATDVWAEIPPLLLLTSAKDRESLLLMGDLHMDIGPVHVHDLLERYDANFLADTEGLQRYRQLLDYALHSIDLRRLKETDPVKEREVLAKLDKYKILRMVERAWELRPERRWYIFVEPSTYLVRSNLLAWLSHFNPAVPVFFANPPFAAWSTPSAMGGTAFILSEGAMRALLVHRSDVIPYYNPRLADHASAYDALAAVLSSTLSLSPNKTWPGISGFNPSTIPFGPGLWCEPVLAMHALPSDLASALWRFGREREEQHHAHEPLLFADIWIRFMQPENLEDPHDDWDNLSSGPEYGQWNILFEGAGHASHRHRHHQDVRGRARPAEESWEACRDTCGENELCVQWSYSSVPVPNHNENGETKCHLSRSMRFGGHVEPRDIERGGEKMELRWKSGWQKEKFLAWARQQRCQSQQS